MSTKRFSILAILAAAVSLASFAQSPPPCTTRALRTVDEAQTLALKGDKAGAKKQLETAEKECGNSYPVIQGISKTYLLIGDQLLADVYAKSAARLAPGGSNANTTVAGANPGAGPAPAASKEDKSVVREKYALVVGLGSFQSDKIPTLKYSAKDASDFAKLLTDPEVGRFQPQNVTLLTNDKATSKEIRNALYNIAAKALEDDLVLLYFSTHGSSPSMDRTKVGAGYLVTYDTEVSELYATAYGMDELARFIKEKIRAKRIVTFLDTCYSGDTARLMAQGGSKGLTIDGLSSESIGQIVQGKGSAVITSSTNQELSWESDEAQNSFFTLFLMESLRQHQGLGNLRDTYTDLQRKLPTSVRSYTRQKGLGDAGQGVEQNPAIYPLTNIPDIVIGAPTQ